MRGLGVVGVASGLALLICSGCASKVWYKPGATQVDFRRDMAAAELAARQAVASRSVPQPQANYGGGSGTLAFWSGAAQGAAQGLDVASTRAQTIALFMQSRGWTLLSRAEAEELMQRQRQAMRSAAADRAANNASVEHSPPATVTSEGLKPGRVKIAGLIIDPSVHPGTPDPTTPSRGGENGKAVSKTPPDRCRTPAALQRVQPQVIESRIDGEFTGWEYEKIFRLQNGQVWQQTSFDISVNMRMWPEVLIFRSTGGWKMTVEGVTGTIRVTRLK